MTAGSLPVTAARSLMQHDPVQTQLRSNAHGVPRGCLHTPHRGTAGQPRRRSSFDISLVEPATQRGRRPRHLSTLGGQAMTKPHFWWQFERCENAHAKTVVVVVFGRPVPVAVGATHVVIVVVPRAAAHHARDLSICPVRYPCDAGCDGANATVFSQPPSRRPTSRIIALAW